MDQKAYRFGLSNPNLSAVISNMVDEKQVNENLAVITAQPRALDLYREIVDEPDRSPSE